MMNKSTAIFIMVVSSTVLALNVLEIAIFPIGWIFSRPFEKSGNG